MTPRILAVDDEPLVLGFLKEVLTGERYEVVACAGADEAVAALEDGDFDAAFVDISLVQGSGIEVLAAVRERRPNCPVIMITGAPTIDTATEALRRGAFDYIVKPVRLDTLLRACRIALEHKSLVEEREAYRANLEAIFKGLPDLVVMVDDRMRVVEANRGSMLCGAGAGTMLGRQFGESAGCAVPRCVALLTETLRTGRPAAAERVECRCEGVPDSVVSLTASPLADGRGKVIGALLVVKDQTRLAELERRLQARPGAECAAAPLRQGCTAKRQRTVIVSP